MDDCIAESSSKGQGTQRFKGFHLPELVNPKSAYGDHVPALPISEEKLVLEDILVSLLLVVKFYHCKVDRIKGRRQNEGRR